METFIRPGLGDSNRVSRTNYPLTGILPTGVRVEIQEADGTPLIGFAAADCPEIIGDEIERLVAWKTEKGQPPADLGKLAGKPVRLRFILADADIFSFRFR